MSRYKLGRIFSAVLLLCTSAVITAPAVMWFSINYVRRLMPIDIYKVISKATKRLDFIFMHLDLTNPMVPKANVFYRFGS